MTLVYSILISDSCSLCVVLVQVKVQPESSSDSSSWTDEPLTSPFVLLLLLSGHRQLLLSHLLTASASCVSHGCSFCKPLTKQGGSIPVCAVKTLHRHSLTRNQTLELQSWQGLMSQEKLHHSGQHFKRNPVITATSWAAQTPTQLLQLCLSSSHWWRRFCWKVTQKTQSHFCLSLCAAFKMNLFLSLDNLTSCFNDNYADPLSFRAKLSLSDYCNCNVK